MNQATLRMIWITVALLMFVFIFNMHSATQKSDFALVIKLPIEFKASENITPVGYALHGLRGLALFFWLVPFLAWLHARREVKSAAAAFPFRLLDVEPSSGPGIVIQTIAFLLLLGAPFASAWHFWTFLTMYGQVCRNRMVPPCEDGLWSRPVSANLWDHTYRMTDGSSNNGPSYEPMFEPALALLLCGIAAGFTLLLIVEMFRVRSRVEA
ncbi:hypothetical protein HFO38_15650 [Rhizobium leguminosarum]|nr:hypothetical protein [Rhizobium leguminosarum]